MKKYLEVLHFLGLPYNKIEYDYTVLVAGQCMTLNFFFDWKEEEKVRVKTENFEQIFSSEKTFEQFFKEILQKRCALKKVEDKIKSLVEESGVPIFYDEINNSWIIGNDHLFQLDLKFDEKWKYLTYFGPKWNQFTKLFYPEHIMKETNILTDDIEKLENTIIRAVEKTVKKERFQYLFN